MDNAEEILHYLEVFTNCKTKSITPELNNYLSYVARTGELVFQWGIVKDLFKEKLLSVLTDLKETSQGIELANNPNIDPFNYDSKKNALLERLDTFLAAPFTLQRICELLINPRKQYNRIDKFMRAIEKSILVVSTTESRPESIEQDDGDSADVMHKNSDNFSITNYNVDIEMDRDGVKDVDLKVARFNKLEEQSNHKECEADDIDDDSQVLVKGIESQDKDNGFNNISDNNEDVEKDIDGAKDIDLNEARFNNPEEQSNHKKCDADDTIDNSKSPVSGLDLESQDLEEVTEYRSITPPDSLNDENVVHESDSIDMPQLPNSKDEEGKSIVIPKIVVINDENIVQQSDSIDEDMPKPPDSKDEEEKSIVTPKTVIHVDMNDQKESIAEVCESNSDADKLIEETANNETTPVPNDDVKTQVTTFTPYDDKVYVRNIEDVSAEENIKQDADQMNHKPPDVNTNVDQAVEKCEVQAESIPERPVTTMDHSENEAPVKVLNEEPLEQNVQDCTITD